MERTVLLIKPDGVSRGLNFEIAERFEARGFVLVGCRMQQAGAEAARAHYTPRLSGEALDAAVASLTAGPIVAMAWQAEGALALAREMAGDADPLRAKAGTVRGDLAATAAHNLVEVSADAEAAVREMRLWFNDELVAEGAGAPARRPQPAGVGAGAAAGGGAESGEGKSKAQLKKEAKKAEKLAKKEAHRRAAAGEPEPAAPERPPISVEPPSGTRDFHPEEMRVRTWLFGKFREAARKMAFVEYDAPVLESEDLYKRKGGEEIVQQMYNFVDKDGHAVTLRPEMTPTLARMILSLGGKVLLPFKWYSLPQCWRFETVQRGRKREHFQWNMDIIGEPSIAAEVELLAAITTFFASVGVTSRDVGIKVNSRRVLGAILDMYGVGDDKFAEVCIVVDKLDKIGADAVVELLVKEGLAEEGARKIVASLSIKSVDELAALTGGAGGEAVKELQDLFRLAEAYGFADWIAFDASVVRGLAYYTGIVFEGFDRRGELRAICGGGRYDRLLSLYGSPTPVPACGFGFGDCVIMELLNDLKLVPRLEPQIDFVLVSYNADMQPHAARVAAALRAVGFAVDVLLQPAKKVAKAFSYADRVRGERVIFVAPDEWSKGLVRVKDLRAAEGTDKEVDVPVDSLVDALGKLGIRPP